MGTPTVRMAGFALVFAVIQLASNAVSAMPLTPEYFALSLVGGALAAPLLSVLLRALSLKRAARLVLVWLGLFIVQIFADLIEGVFFTTRISTLPAFFGSTLLGLAVTLVESLTGLLLFPSSSPSSSVLSLRPYFSDWFWLSRLAVGSVAYFPVYFVFGALVSPIVIPYYTDPSLGLGLTIPSFSILIPIELLRGVLFVLALVSLIVEVRLPRRTTFILVALFLFVIGAFVPFVGGTDLPWVLKFYHSLEILADSVVYSAILVYLFKRVSN